MNAQPKITYQRRNPESEIFRNWVLSDEDRQFIIEYSLELDGYNRGSKEGFEHIKSRLRELNPFDRSLDEVLGEIGIKIEYLRSFEDSIAYQELHLFAKFFKGRLWEMVLRNDPYILGLYKPDKPILKGKDRELNIAGYLLLSRYLKANFV